MPFYRTPGRRDAGHFPHTPVKPSVIKHRRDEYLHMERSNLIALCDERGILSVNGTPIGRNQRKSYYIRRLVEWDTFNVTANQGE